MPQAVPLASSLTFDLHCLSELYSGIHLPGSNINGNKIKSEHGSHIRIHTTYNLIMFTHKHMYANPMISVVSTQICHPSNQAGIK
jgi:hypothetical protein